MPFLKKCLSISDSIKLAGICLLVCLSHAVSAQYRLAWQNADSLNRRLQAGRLVQIRKFEGTLPGGRQIAAYLAVIRLKSKLLTVEVVPAEGGKGLATVSQTARQRNSLVAVNGGYFTFRPDTVRDGLSSVSLLIHRGKLIAPHKMPVFRKDGSGIIRALYPTRSAVGFVKNKAVFAWTFTDSLGNTRAYDKPNPFTVNPLRQNPPSQNFPSVPRRWQTEEATGGGPMLVWKRQKQITDRQEWFTQIADVNPRTAVGLDQKGNLLLLVIDGRQPGYSEGVTFDELAEIFLGLNAVYALNLDGGGSSTMVVQGAVINRPSDKTGERKVASVLSVGLNRHGKRSLKN